MEQMTGTFVVHVVYKQIEKSINHFTYDLSKPFLAMLVNLEFEGDGCKVV